MTSHDDTPTSPEDPMDTVGQPFNAMHSGVCQRTGDRIEPGDRIARLAEQGAGYVHDGRCP